MSQQCAITKCNRASRWLCDCCQQNLCLQHLNEHNTSLIFQLNPLTDEINALGDRLKTLNIQKIVGRGHQKLEQWRADCHEMIDRFFKQKCQKLDRLVDEKVGKQNIEIGQLRSKMAKLIEEQETTQQDIDSIKSAIRYLDRKIYDLEQTCFQINIRPLVIDDNSISIDERSEHEIDLSALSQACKTISRPPGSSMLLACNKQHLLLHQKPNLCLVDREMNIVKKILYSDNELNSMCWSSTLNQFIILAEDSVLLLHEKTGLINVAQINKQQYWLSCACSDTFLFLSTNELASCVFQFGLLPSIEFIKEWKSADTCTRDEIINDIICRNERLALVIKNKLHRSIRMELRSIETLDRIWSLRLNIICDNNVAFGLCSLTCNEWLMVDYEEKRLFQITEDGKIKRTTEYEAKPAHAILFGSNVLVVSRFGGINFHKL